MHIKCVSNIFLLVLTVGYCLENEDCECDDDMKRSSLNSLLEASVDVQESYAARIVRGNVTSIKNHPHHVFILMLMQRGDGYTTFPSYCGGSIISTKWILTAGHCRGQNMQVVVGSNVINRGKRYKVVKSVLFPEYLRIEGISHYDYLLLKLYFHLRFNSSIRPIKLGAWSDIINGVMANVTGFGQTSEIGRQSKLLRVVRVPVIDYNRCLSWRGDLYFHEFCAGYEAGGISTCKGDSGGGLVVSGKLIGLVSHQRECARPRKPTVYSAIPYAANWICSVTGICPTHCQETINYIISLKIHSK